MDRVIKINISLSIFFLTILFSCCNTNVDTSNNKIDTLNKLNKLDSVTQTETQAVIDTALPPESYKSADYDKIGFELMGTESFGEIKIGLTANKLIELLQKPDKKSKLIMWGADGQYHQTWYYYQNGIELDIKGKDITNQVVSMITINAPCILKTKRRIGIDSDINDVNHAYKKAIDPTFSDTKAIVAGSIYGGIIFSIENKKVKQIFIGASAE